MARIRSVKPEIWTDPEFIECSLSARLLLIALFNFASDYGVIHNKPRQLKMLCLPGDPVEIGGLIEELIEQRFLIDCIAPNGDNVLVIRTFTKNQKINRATLGRYGDPAKWTHDSRLPNTTHGALTERHPSDGKGRDNTDNSDRVPDSVSTDAFGRVPDGLPAGEVVPLGLLTREQRRHALTNGTGARHALTGTPTNEAAP